MGLDTKAVTARDGPLPPAAWNGQCRFSTHGTSRHFFSVGSGSRSSGLFNKGREDLNVLSVLIACLGMLEQTPVRIPPRTQHLGSRSLRAVRDDEDPGDGTGAGQSVVRVVGGTLGPPGRAHPPCRMLGLKGTHRE